MGGFVTASNYLALPREPQPWVIEKLVPVGGLVNIFGKPKTGKSFVMLGICEAMANGAPDWEGFAIKKHGPVAYLQVDTPREEWAERLLRMEWITPEAQNNFHLADMWQIPNYPMNILEPQTAEWLKSEMERMQPVMVVLDTLRECHGLDENDSTAMRNVISTIVGCCRPAAIVLITHARKDSITTSLGDDDLMDQGRGSSYVSGRMDVIIKISAKRMVFKGRATGQQQFTIKQDDRGFVHVERESDDHFKQAALALNSELPGLSDNAKAVKLAATCGVSHSTALRKLKALGLTNPG